MFKLTMKSKNRKTGNIPVSMSPKHTCPDACPMKNNGCYAALGPLNIQWQRYSKTSNVKQDYAEFISNVKALPNGQLWRHNQAGDLLMDAKHHDRINANAAMKLAKANTGKVGFTYTHYPILRSQASDNVGIASILANRKAIESMNRLGFTVNISANNLAHADVISDSNINAPIVSVVPINSPAKLTTPKGHKVIVCPSQTRSNVTCATCKLCANAKRKVIIGFRVHGVATNKMANIVNNWRIA